MHPTCTRATATVVIALALAACGTGSVATDDWARDQLPTDIETLSDASTGMRSAGADCERFDDRVDAVRGHPHPDDALVAQQWEHFLQVVDDLGEACWTRDTALIVPAFDRFASLLVELSERVPARA
jgi:hypothetical protein